MKILFCFLVVTFIQVVISQGYVNPLRRSLNKNSKAQNPGVKVRINRRGLNYAASIAADLMAKEVPKFKIPDISGKKFVRYSVKNIRIVHFRKPVPDVSMIPGHGIRLQLKNAALEASARWRYKKAFVRDSGSVKASSSSISIGLSINILSDSNGRPSLKAHSCSASFGGFKVKLRGGASFLYNLIFKAFKSKVRSSIEKQICKAAENTINKNGNKQLSTLNLHAKLTNGLVLDYFLTSSPTFAGNYLETSHRGVFLNDPEKPTIPLIGASSSAMVGFSIAAESFNSAGRLAFKQNLLQREFEVKAIKNLLVKLDKSFKKARIFVKLKPKSAPKISIRPGLLIINLEAIADLVAKFPGRKEMPLLTVDLGLEAATSVALIAEKVVVQLRKIDPKASVKISHIGQISSEFLKEFLDEGIEMALPFINEKLKKGFPLPNVTKVKFPKAILSLNQGYLSIATEIIYKP